MRCITPLLRNLDRRGVGDVHTLTVAEYRGRPWPRRLAYRLFRNPVVMFGLASIWAMFVQPRLVSRSMRPRIRRATIIVDVALLALVGACALIGWREYMLVQAPTALLAGAVGVFLFYVQHQRESTPWTNGEQWSGAHAGREGEPEVGGGDQRGSSRSSSSVFRTLGEANRCRHWRIVSMWSNRPFVLATRRKCGSALRAICSSPVGSHEPGNWRPIRARYV